MPADGWEARSSVSLARRMRWSSLGSSVSRISMRRLVRWHIMHRRARTCRWMRSSWQHTRKKMSVSEMYYGYPETSHGYFRSFRLYYSVPTDSVEVKTR